MFTSIWKCSFLTLALLLAGCAAPKQAPLELKPSALAGATRVGVAMSALPKIEVALPGASCLLCIAVASAMNSSLSKHATTLSLDEFKQVKAQIASSLQKRGVQVVDLIQPIELNTLPSQPAAAPNSARKNFGALQVTHNIDKLLLVEVQAAGFQRNYSAYIPTSDPKGYIEGKAYLVDLKTHFYEWYQDFFILRSADGKWDEPPNFPGLTNAYFQALESAKDSLLRPLRQ